VVHHKTGTGIRPDELSVKTGHHNSQCKQSVLTRDVVRIINDVAEKVKKQPSFPEDPERIAGRVINVGCFWG
jgi:hypothetical protein